MPSRIFQNVIIQMKDSIDRTVGVVDDQGYVIACSELAAIGSRFEDFRYHQVEAGTHELVTAGRTYVLLSSERGQLGYAAFVEGTDRIAKTICAISAVAFDEALCNYEEKHNRAAFVKNIISDNILPGDVYVRAKELHSVQIEKALYEQLGIRCVIGISTEARHLRELADRYKEAQVAIDVGRVFDSDKTIIHYESLGLGRIIYQLPTTLCEMFLSEVFKKNPIETLDEDTLETINRFFENNLNVSETSRKLYVHRNTLVYRLEKIKKITGLDLREFDHAIVFKVAMMVKQYVDSLNTARY